VADDVALKMALIENIQREDLNPLEEAQGLQRLIEEFDMTHQAVAESVGRSRVAVSNLLRLLNLAKPVQAMLLDGQIEMGHARALLPLSAARQTEVAHEVARRGLSVREVERLVNRLLHPKPARAPAKDRDVLRLEEELSESLGTKVSITANRKGAGRITIEFSDLDQLDGILGRLRE
jgi:ParB family chromosome partitioning protein